MSRIKKNLDYIHRKIYGTSGIAFIESLLSLTLLFIVLGTSFRFYVDEDLRNNLVQAATGTINDSRSTGFLTYKRIDGEQVPFGFSGDTVQDDADKVAVTTNLQNLGRILVNSTKKNSSLSAGAQELRCMLQLGYLTLNGGRVKAAPSLFPTDPVTVDARGPQTPDTLLVEAFNNTKTRFESNIADTILLGPDSRLRLYPESPVQEVYFDYTAFIIWGCKAETNLLGLISTARSIQTGAIIQRRISDAG